ncbi:MAG TPA: cation:proton antiporter [Fibrobacteria bacterium]|mgnify:CR=1 FL=1|nr:cation:proton antiporter [Fibrobacteria bacterium]
MDSGTILVIGSCLVIGFHLMDLLAHRLRIPSVVLLLAAGMATRQILDVVYPGTHLPGELLQGLGAVGLALIVLEGSMGLEWKPGSGSVFLRAAISALGGILIFLVVAAPLLHWIFELSWKTAILHALPLSVISSAIAIPSASRLAVKAREFISVESSLSDIAGVLLFNAVILPGGLGLGTFWAMGWRSIAVIAASTLLIALLLRMLRSGSHHIRFVPILAILILFYAVGKQVHLPSLLLVFLFGIAFANMRLLPYGDLREIFVRPEFESDALLLRTLVAESAFLARTFFFFLFGYSMDFSTLLHPLPWLLGGAFLGAIYLGRHLLLLAVWEGPSRQILSIAPRGLITVLLMGMVPGHLLVGEVATGPVLVVILGTTLAQLLGGKEIVDAAGNPSEDPTRSAQERT